MASVYVETTIISYLASRPATDVIIAGHQAVTRKWWDARRSHYELFCSQLVLDEAGAGDAEVAGRRLGLVDGLPLLEIVPECLELARSILTRGALPKKAQADALHIATAAVHGMDFLLTWNCKHIANAEIFRVVSKICDQHGIDAPIICTPDELMGDQDEV